VDIAKVCDTLAMPKRISRNSQDVNQAAFQMVHRSSQTEPNPAKAEISRVMAAMGRKGGRIGGKRRLETMTAAERKEVAQRAAKARWSKAK
jgi:hypothetical protein